MTFSHSPVGQPASSRPRRLPSRAPWVALIAILSTVVIACGAPASTSAYRAVDAFPGLHFVQPLGIVTAPGETDRVFILEKPGVIQAVTGLQHEPVKAAFFDLTSQVRAVPESEEGLLGVAFHPSFSTNRFFYVFYTTNATTEAGTGRHDRVSRFTALPPPAGNADILATEVPLISQYDEASNHNGGDLHFGPDGYLYIALGDEGAANDIYGNSQHIDRDFFAGLLRIDVDQRPENALPNPHPSVHPGTYRVPADNPFVGATRFNGAPVDPSEVRTGYWAVGLRNPWRFSFDAPSGRLLLGDVGQSAREEINLITRGGNYGWNYREGSLAGPGGPAPTAAEFIDPLWEVGRDLAASITGGVVYRGSRFPGLEGRYVFGDFAQDRIFIMAFAEDGSVEVNPILREDSPAGFGIDPSNGDVLMASLERGVIRRILPEAPSASSATSP